MSIRVGLPHPAKMIVLRAMLLSGVVSSLLYILMNIVVPMRWPGYSPFAHTVSELSAVGAPTRMSWVWPSFLYSAMVIAFGLGVRLAASGRRNVRSIGGLLLTYGLVCSLWPLVPMHQRAVLAAGGATLSDTLHLVLAGITVVLMLVTMGLGAASFGRNFRRYTIASMIVLAVFGALTSLEAEDVNKDLATPWIGLWERINIGVFLVWIVVLAVNLWPVRVGHNE